MPRTDPIIVCHHLDMDLTVKLVYQRKRKNGEEKRIAIKDEIKKLVKASFI